MLGRSVASFEERTEGLSEITVALGGSSAFLRLTFRERSQDFVLSVDIDFTSEQIYQLVDS